MENPLNKVFITGDSISMPCEAASVLSASQIYIYPVSNQNAGHCAFVEWMYAHGYANIIESSDKNSGIVARPVVSAEPEPLDASQQIANGIRAHLAPLLREGRSKN